MKIKKFTDPVLFQSIVREYLIRDEAENNLPLGILSSIIAGEYLETTPYMSLIEEGDKLRLVIMCTPPHPVLFTYQETSPPRAILRNVLIDLSETLGENFTGITANKILAFEIYKTWEELTGKKAKPIMAMRIYKLEQVKPVKGIPGRMRSINRGDEQMLLKWYSNFLSDISDDKPDPDRVKKFVHRFRDIEKLHRGSRGLMFWEVDGTPVSMAGYSGPTPHGIRIGMVYTPKEEREKGYASACTAGLSQHLLDQGFQFCFLFTNLSNQTSNHIYQQIGYEGVCDVDQYSFKDNDQKDES